MSGEGADGYWPWEVGRCFPEFMASSRPLFLDEILGRVFATGVPALQIVQRTDFTSSRRDPRALAMLPDKCLTQRRQVKQFSFSGYPKSGPELPRGLHMKRWDCKS